MVRVRLQLESVKASPAKARRFVAHLFDEWGVATKDSGVRDTAVLLVSELVTNAVIHAGTRVDLVVARDGCCRATTPTNEADSTICTCDQPENRAPLVLRVEVHDTSYGRPVPQHAGPNDDSGRGLALVEALAHRWGVASTPDGKSVWFELVAAAN